MDTFEPPKYIASLIAAINDSAKTAQTGAFAFALIGLYLLATAFSATDEDLLLDRTLAIAQLGAQIPVTVSFAIMPILFVALHVFTLIRYDMLTANLRQFCIDLETMVWVASDRERCRQLLANVEFIQNFTAPPGSALRSRLFGFVAWVVIAGFPIIVLLAVQTNALRYQSQTVTTVQRVALLVDLAVLFWFYNRQRRQQTTRNTNTVSATVRRWGTCLVLPTVVATINLVWLNIPEPKDITVNMVVARDELAIARDRGYHLRLDGFPQLRDLVLCPKLNWGCRYLRVDHRMVIGKVWDNKAIVELRAKQPLTDQRRAGFEGVFLRNRSLQFIDLSESRMYGADMIEANLSRATLSRASLAGSNLRAANLRGADLSDADLSGADLAFANLLGADLSRANLTGTVLYGAYLILADLSAAKVSQAQLDNACGTGASLTDGLTLKPCPEKIQQRLLPK
jgi:uncharacterized protein YjbI with pentapeptide repeats